MDERVPCDGVCNSHREQSACPHSDATLFIFITDIYYIMRLARLKKIKHIINFNADCFKCSVGMGHWAYAAAAIWMRWNNRQCAARLRITLLRWWIFSSSSDAIFFTRNLVSLETVGRWIGQSHFLMTDKLEIQFGCADDWLFPIIWIHWHDVWRWLGLFCTHSSSNLVLWFGSLPINGFVMLVEKKKHKVS